MDKIKVNVIQSQNPAPETARRAFYAFYLEKVLALEKEKLKQKEGANHG
ncbi:hypothetical protein [Anaerotalea alkaliphila]|uniref:Uncharacterized protein n=1 Tax=Anaerotalea alkaliphila TaxID=2662126 RepID=A0A7X5KN02_9FIRM|nr:hypothetical protein [Anaerotalea alkaliphila]NDL68491.1 hypothetical protein [Anaerotalea alkaliphila]